MRRSGKKIEMLRKMLEEKEQSAKIREDMDEERAEEQMSPTWMCDLTCGTTETKFVCFLFSASLSAESCAPHCSSCHGNDSAELKPGVLLSLVTIGLLRGERKESGRGMCFFSSMADSAHRTPLTSILSDLHLSGLAFLSYFSVRSTFP